MNKISKALLGAAIVVACLGNTGCEPEKPSAREKNIKAQTSMIERATAAIPVPQVDNFLAREAVAKQVRRLDEAGKLFYVYIFGQNGQQMGYYVANTRPVATCSLLTPPENVQYNEGSQGSSWSTLRAPGMGGTYSPNPSCGSVFFFDAATNAYIELSGMSYFVSDQPLSVKSDPIRVISEAKK